jgi:hypothetical protein
MFRRSSTELVKERVAAIAARLEELILLAAEQAEAEKEIVPLKEQVKNAKESNYSSFCLDCKKRDNCIGDVARVYYCSNKIPEKD